MTAPRFRVTADEPPKKKGGMFGPEHSFDSEEGLILDEFTFEGLIHLECMTDGYYHLRVGGDVYAVTRKGGRWSARRTE